MRINDIYITPGSQSSIALADTNEAKLIDPAGLFNVNVTMYLIASPVSIEDI